MMGTDDPPGTQALSLPPFIPPDISRSSRRVVPNSISKLPGLFTCPETLKSFVPREFLVDAPRVEYHSPPRSMI